MELLCFFLSAAKLTETIVTDGSPVAAITATPSKRAPAAVAHKPEVAPVVSASKKKHSKKHQQLLHNKFDINVTSSTSSLETTERVKPVTTHQRDVVTTRITSTPKPTLTDRSYEKKEITS